MSDRDRRVLRVRRASWTAAVALAAVAALPAPAHAAPCAVMMLSDYLALADCTIGVLTAKNFGFDALSSGIDAKDITVTPVSGPGGVGFRLTFPTGELSSNGAERALRIDFTITDVSVDPLIKSARQTMEAERTGSGVARVTDGLPLSTTLQAGVTVLESTHTFAAPVHFASFSARVSAETGFANPGTARVSQYTQTIQAVTPEPGTLLLLGTGLLGVLGAARRARAPLARWSARSECSRTHPEPGGRA